MRIAQFEKTEVKTYQRKHGRNWWQSHRSIRFEVIQTFNGILDYMRSRSSCIVTTFIGNERVSLKRFGIVRNNKNESSSSLTSGGEINNDGCRGPSYKGEEGDIQNTGDLEGDMRDERKEWELAHLARYPEVGTVSKLAPRGCFAATHV